MPQTIQIETQAEQQGLTDLGAQRTTGRASRELALHQTEQTLDPSTAAIKASRERPPHLGTHSADAPGFLSALGRDYTLRPELAPDVDVISLAVERGVGQHQTNGRSRGSRCDEVRQIPTIVPGPAARALRQQKLLIQIRHDHPLQPMPPGQRFLPVMMHAPHEEGADRSLHQAPGIASEPWCWSLQWCGRFVQGAARHPIIDLWRHRWKMSPLILRRIISPMA